MHTCNISDVKKAHIEAKLKLIDDYKTEGLILKSRCRWYEKGEKSNEYFLRYRNRVETKMNKLKTKIKFYKCKQTIIKTYIQIKQKKIPSRNRTIYE